MLCLWWLRIIAHRGRISSAEYKMVDIAIINFRHCYYCSPIVYLVWLQWNVPEKVRKISDLSLVPYGCHCFVLSFFSPSTGVNATLWPSVETELYSLGGNLFLSLKLALALVFESAFLTGGFSILCVMASGGWPMFPSSLPPPLVVLQEDFPPSGYIDTASVVQGEHYCMWMQSY